MTKDVNAEIAALETEEEKEVKKKIKQVEAALEGLRAETDEARDEAFGKAGIYADRWTWEQLKAELGRLRDYLTEKQKEKNLLLEKQGTELKKKIKLLNEETERVEVWTVKGQAQFDARFLRSNMDLFSKDGAVVDDFDEIVAATPAELKNPTSYRYVARPTVGKSKLQYANEMAHNVAATLEAHAGSWLEGQGLCHHFKLGFYHDAHSGYNVYLQSSSWKTEKNDTGVREHDLLFILQDANVICLGSVKTKVTNNHIRELQTDMSLLRDPTNVNIRTDSDRDGSSFISIADALPFDHSSLAVVGLAVTAVPNAKLDLKREDNIIVIESRGDFSLAAFVKDKSAAKSLVEAVCESVARQRQEKIIPIAAFLGPRTTPPRRDNLSLHYQ
eukprot:CAMPEP_0118920564 /NCGR_PEP_ID=MMETSP1166-20130328/19132_1 /TAXON_ID=1104430 /ORGANISM="Chrysoreinhardia sp, Strain CCMP3193" /LENGTH=387 /DNA_ID=CAMNT_0006861103 /DNA_START=30 /DNA_END=1194 /DNA_ORIENTATION=-